MSINSEMFLREGQAVKLEITELANSVVLTIEVKEDYRTMGRFRLFSDTPEQEMLIRMLAEAYEKSKNCIPLELV
jgi:hypothetical protein